MPTIINEEQLLAHLDKEKTARCANLYIEITKFDATKKVPMAFTKKGNVIKFWGWDKEPIEPGVHKLLGDYTKNDYKGKTYINWNRPDPTKAAPSPNSSEPGTPPENSSTAPVDTGGGDPAPGRHNSPCGGPSPAGPHTDPALTLTAATVTLAGAYLQAAAPIAGTKSLNLEAVTKRAAEVVKATYDTFKKEAM